tara:strand:- start:240 stop:932 length:693 start_codon:yes stop_codon:yes gene_type:complete
MNIVKLFSVSQGMSAIKRYSGLHLIHEESVMEHTGFVCLFVYSLSEEINASCYPTITHSEINIGKALKKAVVHDVDEVITGDIPRPTKYYNKETVNVFSEIAHQGINSILDELKIHSVTKNKILSDWYNSKKDREGFIVALADLASVVYKLWEEIILLGNKKLLRQAKEVNENIKVFEREIQKTKLLEAGQKLIIYQTIEQLYDIMSKIMKIENPILGTLKPFKEKVYGV